MVGSTISPADCLAREHAAFLTRTRRSQQRFERALGVFPGGDTRAVTFYRPYPAVIAAAHGIRLEDLDGNVYRDFLLNYTSMIVGHSHPEVVAEIVDVAQRGTAVAAPVPGQIELAEEIIGRVPSIERIRFVNSGSEATMGAIRIARAFTGREIVIKAIGGYHGSYPDLDVGLRPDSRPAGIPDVPTRLVPYNDVEALRTTLAQCAETCAAVILEPVLGAAGVVPASNKFLLAAQEGAREIGALFILDEVITFRLGPGGAQGLLGLRPDLTTLGKFIGGGLPVGAVGGRADVMGVLAPGAEKSVSLSGTFNGNPVTVAAGRATLALLDGNAFRRLDELGARLAEGLSAGIKRHGLPAQVTHVGSLVNVHFTAEPVTNADAAATADPVMAQTFHLGLMNRGIFIAPRGLLAIATVTRDEDVDAAVSAADQIFELLAGGSA